MGKVQKVVGSGENGPLRAYAKVGTGLLCCRQREEAMCLEVESHQQEMMQRKPRLEGGTGTSESHRTSVLRDSGKPFLQDSEK